MMPLTVREMMDTEVDLIIDYFYNATPEYLETLGVDPTRLPPAQAWRDRLCREGELAFDQRSVVPVIWLSDDRPVGFSTADKIRYGEQANMHLHVSGPGAGSRRRCRMRAAYRRLLFRAFETEAAVLRAERLQRGAEPHPAKGRFQISQDPHDRASPVNFHQAVTRWVIER